MSSQPNTSLNVAVVGAGVMGAMTAWRLALRGVQVTLFERHAPAHDQGATGGDTRIFRVACKEGSTHVPLIRASLPLWHELEAAAGRQLLKQTGVASIGRPEDASMQATLATAHRFGLPLEVLASNAAAERYPQFPVAADECLYLDPEGGFIRADHTVLAAVAQACALGAQLRAYTTVEALAPDSTGVTLRAGELEQRYTHAIVAPGGWGHTFAALAALPLVPRRIALSWFAAADMRPFADDRALVMMRTLPDGYFNCFPSTDGATLKGSCNIGGWPSLDSPDALPRTLPKDELARLRHVAAQSLRGVYPDPVRIGIYMDAFTPDGEGLLGAVDPAARLIVAGGFSGHGFKFSPAVGEAAAQLVVDGQARLPVAHLDPARYLR
ncbi:MULTISPECIES: N-methyl-L-tryptophan oxidase [Bordetella]|uniref:N-methyltryptophan oxidase n=2 Tax=Bordetella TaxID=517 RepID=A0A261W0Z3_9BORD|nr:MULTISPECIES: N-methyl-L-tryptophan oxidase [Bordetella]MDM9558744.1 N-methyl-L-tryptophan oxidase [Bordetella petrii]OZI79995.1 N-methyltryptophan oxidase [Bordetella genomosp. 2]